LKRRYTIPAGRHAIPETNTLGVRKGKAKTVPDSAVDPDDRTTRSRTASTCRPTFILTLPCPDHQRRI